jgi:pimeloyl-[acyl-carrier protein] methyl ester esterase
MPCFAAKMPCMKLHRRVEGEGPPLVLLHGWGMHSGVWQPLLPALSAHCEVHCIDLPGHGKSPAVGRGAGLERWATAVAEAAPPGSAWLGWSLGGQVALAAALSGRDICRLVLVATTPRFLTAADWDCAMAPEVFANFSRDLSLDPRRAARNFVSLQLRGDRQAMALLPNLRALLGAAGDPDPESLQQGLDILATTDLRGPAGMLPLPALVVAGERDRLAPPEAARRLAALLPSGCFELLRGAAHTPFLTHPEHFVESVLSFMAQEAVTS